MSSEKNLKLQNRASFWVLLLFNCVLLVMLLCANAFEGAVLSLKILFSLRSASLIVAYIIVFVVNGQLSSNDKARLVFWRWKDPLPGCRAFSHHGKNDHRVNIERLEQLHGNLPSSPENRINCGTRYIKVIQQILLL